MTALLYPVWLLLALTARLLWFLTRILITRPLLLALLAATGLLTWLLAPLLDGSGMAPIWLLGAAGLALFLALVPRAVLADRRYERQLAAGHDAGHDPDPSRAPAPSDDPWGEE